MPGQKLGVDTHCWWSGPFWNTVCACRLSRDCCDCLCFSELDPMMFLTTSRSKHVIVLIEMQSWDHAGQKQCMVCWNNSRAGSGPGLICRLRWFLRLSRFRSFNLFFFFESIKIVVWHFDTFFSMFLKNRNQSSFSESQFPLVTRVCVCVCVKEGRVIDWMQTQHLLHGLTAPVTEFKLTI